MIIRIPIDDTNSKVSYVYPSVSNPTVGDANQALSPAQSGLPSAEFSLLDFTLAPTAIPAYASSQYAYGVKKIDVTVPDDDKSTVAAWFGNGAGGTTPSDTLVKRMTNAVIGAMEDFFADASRIGLFTRPFRLGYALLTTEGKLICTQTPKLVTPNAQAPVMAIRTANPSGDLLQTLTEIRNHSSELRVSLPAFTLPDSLRVQVKEVVFYVTDQSTPLTGQEQVTGVRTYVVESGNCPGWYYPRLSADSVSARAMRDNSFRIIGRVEIAAAMQGISDYRLPDTYLDLTDFKSYPEAKDLPDSDDPYEPVDPDPDVPDRPKPVKIIVSTSALDLREPELEKRVRGVTARGIFSRHPDKVTLTLYGAHHRPADALQESGSTAYSDDCGEWKLIARSRGAHLRFIRGIRYRWLRVEVRAPYPSRIDALTFDLNP